MNIEKIKSFCCKNFYVVSVFLITVLIFICRFFMLLKSHNPNGLDGFYYALQTKSFMKYGAFENPDYKTGYYLCSFVSCIFNDAIAGCKIWSALSSTLISLLIYFLTKKITSSKKIGFAAFIFSAFSPSLSIFTINYINNQTGILFVLIYLLCFLEYFNNFNKYSTKKKIINLIPIILFLALCIFSHLVSFALCLIFTTIFLVRKISFKKQIIFISAVIIFSILIFFRQFQRFKNVFSFGPFIPIFSPLMTFVPKSVCIEISIYFVFSWCITIIYAISKRKFDLIYFITPILFFPFWKLNEPDMGYRIFLSAVPFSIILNCFYLQNIFNLKKIFFKEKIISILNPLFILCGLILIFLSTKIYNPKKDPPYDYYKQVIKDIDLPEDSLLIAHLGLNHCYTYYKDLKDCLNYLPDFEVQNNEIWRLAYGVNANYLHQFFGEFDEDELNKFIYQIDNNYVLIREDLWQRYLNYEEDDIVESLNNWFNPHEYRPKFIRNN